MRIACWGSTEADAIVELTKAQKRARELLTASAAESKGESLKHERP